MNSSSSTRPVWRAHGDHVAVQASLIVTPVILTENNVNGAVATYQWYKGLHGRVERAGIAAAPYQHTDPL